MFESLARLTYRRRWHVLGVWLLLVVIAMAGAAQVDKVLGPGNFVMKGSDSARAAQLLDREFHQNDLKVTLVILHNPRATVADAAFRRTAAEIAARIRADAPLQVDYLDNPLISGNRQLISTDRHSMALLFSSTLDEQAIEGQIDHLRTIVRSPGFTTYVAGTAAANHDYAVSAKEDVAKGDSIVIPLLILVLLLVSGTVVAGLLPLVLAGCSIVLSMAAVYIIAHYLDTSVYVTNVIMFLGLGIGIDYSLFIIYRYREELRANANDVETALIRTMTTTGRAIFFSGLTVAIGLSSLILTNVSFMQSMGLGGMLVPLTALLGAMTLLPALLAVLGPKVNRLRVVPRRFLRTGESGSWHRFAMAIMRHPLAAGGLVLAIMLALAFPVTRMSLAASSLKNQPSELQSVAGALYMKAHFPSAPNPVQIVIHHHGPGSLLSLTELAAMRSFERTIREDSEVAQVTGPADYLPASGTALRAPSEQLAGRNLSADGRTALISITARHEYGTAQADGLVHRLRALAAADDALRADRIYVGGAQASFTDFNQALYGHFPLIVAIVLLLTYAFLFYAFRSILLPLKAVLLNLLSVLAAYGILQLVFQGGFGSGLLGFTPESGIASWVPIFLFAFLFGLSMDYEVFLISRIREGWLQTGHNEESVAFGLEKTGRLISSAATIMLIAFSAVIVGRQVQLKEFGVGLFVAIALDASLVRLILVPAIMRLLGTANWWVPAFLRAFASRDALGEGDVIDLEPEQLAA